MPALSANSVYAGGVSIPEYSQIANVYASAEFRRTGNDADCKKTQYANMDDDDKNGGPNHLRAWMIHRDMKGIDLAAALGGSVTPGMVSDLANGKRALSAKWLRRLAPLLGTTPGMLLDHDPRELSADLLDIWGSADPAQRRQLIDVAKAIVRTGTDG
jgi:transcriptional regulator with XRE-family HTH domain